jgi:hypothetical protein
MASSGPSEDAVGRFEKVERVNSVVESDRARLKKGYEGSPNSRTYMVDGGGGRIRGE